MVRVVYETENGNVRSKLLDERSLFDAWTHSGKRGVIVVCGTKDGVCHEIIARQILSIQIVKAVD